MKYDLEQLSLRRKQITACICRRDAACLNISQTAVKPYMELYPAEVHSQQPGRSGA